MCLIYDIVTLLVESKGALECVWAWNWCSGQLEHCWW